MQFKHTLVATLVGVTKAQHERFSALKTEVRLSEEKAFKSWRVIHTDMSRVCNNVKRKFCYTEKRYVSTKDPSRSTVDEDVAFDWEDDYDGEGDAYRIVGGEEEQGRVCEAITLYTNCPPVEKEKFRTLNQHFQEGKSGSRLIVFGHGNIKSTDVGGFSAERLAEFLVTNCGLTRVNRISFVACFAGGNMHLEKKATDSFAESFHRLLL